MYCCAIYKSLTSSFRDIQDFMIPSRDQDQFRSKWCSSPRYYIRRPSKERSICFVVLFVDELTLVPSSANVSFRLVLAGAAGRHMHSIISCVLHRLVGRSGLFPSSETQTTPRTIISLRPDDSFGREWNRSVAIEARHCIIIKLITLVMLGWFAAMTRGGHR